MKIVITHYHLHPGGVTRIIENAVAALASYDVELVVLCGVAPKEDLDLDIIVIPELLYSDQASQIKPKAFAKKLLQIVTQHFSGPPDLWHFHNHSLGKNALVPELVYELAASQALLLQIHDFAEEGRPANYAYLRAHISDMAHLYPAAAQVHYGIINERDLALLEDAGFPSDKLHFIPNPVSLKPPTQPETPLQKPRHQQDIPFIVYPTRSIRRKNIGEFVLWAAIAGSDFIFANTLAPANPKALPIYQQWVDYSKHSGLQIEWGYGEAPNRSFQQIMQTADAVISTSVAEGFGLAFLEPWCFRKALMGRNIPNITEDFSKKGIDLQNLYSRLPIPMDWIDEEQLLAHLKEAMHTYYHAYDFIPSFKNGPEQALHAAMDNNNNIDFGMLDEALQRQVINAVIADPQKRHRFHFSEIWKATQQAPIEKNKKQIEISFSLKAYGENLHAIYQNVISSEQQTLSSHDPESVLKAFLKPEQFCLLKT